MGQDTGGRGESLGSSFSCDLFRKARQGTLNSLGLSSLNNLFRPWAIGVVPSYQVLALELLGQGENWLGCESLIKEVVGVWTLDWLLCI